MTRQSFLLSFLAGIPAAVAVKPAQPKVGISDVYQQFQLDMSGASEIPVTRLFGRTISGLGQSNDADERMYERVRNRPKRKLARLSHRDQSRYLFSKKRS